MITKWLKSRRFPIRPHVFFILLIPAFLSCPVSTLAQAQPQRGLEAKKVLVLQSLTTSAPLYTDTNAGLVPTLESGGVPRANQFFESLDLGRNPGSEHRRLLVELMRVKYGHRKPDMIVTIYPEALDFVLKDARDVFTNIPILALYLPFGFELPRTDRRIIGHTASPDIAGTFEIALKLVPGAKRVYVVGGAHPVDRAREDRARRLLKKWEGRLDFRYLSAMPFEDILATLSHAPRDTIVVLLIFSQDIAGKD
jgi:hypothetical protein